MYCHKSIIQFSSHGNDTCIVMDEVFVFIANDVRNFATMYFVDTKKIPNFNIMYELYDSCTIKYIFFQEQIYYD